MVRRVLTGLRWPASMLNFCFPLLICIHKMCSPHLTLCFPIISLHLHIIFLPKLFLFLTPLVPQLLLFFHFDSSPVLLTLFSWCLTSRFTFTPGSFAQGLLNSAFYLKYMHLCSISNVHFRDCAVPPTIFIHLPPTFFLPPMTFFPLILDFLLFPPHFSSIKTVVPIFSS